MSVEKPTPLDAPLSAGRTLIEASAGSGKTRAITTLVARRVVEQGLEIDRILVVTFTKLATAELRQRIRGIFREIQDACGSSPENGDGQAKELLEKWRGMKELSEKTLKDRIDLALLDIDRANILTIHGFCQRALAEFAFETGFSFGFEVGGSETGIVQSVVRDIWQRRCRECSPVLAKILTQEKFNPAKLAGWFESIRAKRFFEIKGVPKNFIDPADAENQCRAALQSALNTWREHGGSYCRIMKETDALHGGSYPRKKTDENLAWIEGIFNKGDLPADIGRLKGIAGYLGEKNTSGKLKKGRLLPDNPMFEAFDELAAACGALQKAFNDWFAHFRKLLIDEAGDEIARLIRHERNLGYDDLLIEMREALNGDGGETLAASLRGRFPVALIDEFQDTDPTQAQIFHSIYSDSREDGAPEHSGEPKTQSALYLVGDPKQSIYAFRGADVFAYLSAQKDSNSQLLLKQNWRSTPHLVEAVNTLFKAERAFAIDEIDFTPAEPGRDNETRLEIDGETPHPLIFRLPEDQENNDNAAAIAVNDTANDIVLLLNSARAGNARIGTDPLKASDIAVLVRTRAQGSQIAQALRRRGARSVEVNESSVFAAREAGQIHRLLLAVANPGRQAFRRAALTGDLFGLDGEQLLALNEDDECWSRWTRQFAVWRDCWRAKGVGAMLRAAVDSEAGARKLLRYADGPRRLTNLYHLTELLQEAEAENRFSPARLLAWFNLRLRGRADAKNADEDAATLRLDSDEDLVRIMTIHKSKGLEFPVVYLPFAWFSPQQGGKKSAGPLSYHLRGREPGDGTFPTILHLVPDGEDDAKRQLEEFGDSLRLLYVALTRARERCVVTWTRVTSKVGKQLPPLAWLTRCIERRDAPLADADSVWDFAVPQAVADAHDEWRTKFRSVNREDFLAGLRAAAEKCPQGIELHETDETAIANFDSAADKAESDLSVREFGRVTRRIRQMTSFTALSANRVLPPSAHTPAESEVPDHDQSEADSSAQSAADEAEEKPPERNAFSFPRGIQVGTCLHRIFEILGERRERELETVCEEQLKRAGIDSQWNETARDMVEKTLGTELFEPGRSGFRLGEIEKRLTELEFCFPVNSLRRADLGELLQQYGYPDLLGDGQDQGQDQSAQTIDGYLRGFIDLTVEHEGRWYILDYKSNWLGGKAEDYDGDRLEAAMSGHRYQLQYLIYLLALHRYLKIRLGGKNYAYDRHIGGVFYLFLRGMNPAAGMSRGVWFDRPSRECIEALDEFMGGRGS